MPTSTNYAIVVAFANFCGVLSALSGSTIGDDAIGGIGEIGNVELSRNSVQRFDGHDHRVFQERAKEAYRRQLERIAQAAQNKTEMLLFC